MESQRADERDCVVLRATRGEALRLKGAGASCLGNDSTHGRVIEWERALLSVWGSGSRKAVLPDGHYRHCEDPFQEGEAAAKIDEGLRGKQTQCCGVARPRCRRPPI